MSKDVVLEVAGRAPEGVLTSVTVQQALGAALVGHAMLTDIPSASDKRRRMQDLIGRAFLLRIESGGAEAELHGYVAAITATDGGLALELSGPASKADQVVRNAGFERLGVVDIVREALSRCGLGMRQEESPNNDRIEYSVQTEETTWAFVSRLAARHDLVLYEDGGEIVVRPGPRASPVVELSHEQFVAPATVTARAVPTAYELAARSSDPNRVVRKQSGAVKPSGASLAAAAAGGASEAFQYTAAMCRQVAAPHLCDEDPLHQFAQTLGRQASLALVTLSVTARSAELSPGIVVKLDGPDHARGDWVVIEAWGEWRLGGEYSCSIVATPKELFTSLPFPTRVRARGVEEAIVTDDADPEGLGRVRVQFHRDDCPSTWVRVLSSHAGDGCGAAWTPRKDTRVLMGFLHGCADLPVVLGALPHADARPKFTTQNGTGEVRIARTKGGSQVMIVEDGRGGETITVEQGNGNRIELADGGQPTLTILSEGKISVEALSMSLTARESVEIRAPRVDLCGDARATIRAARIDLNPPGGGV